MERDGERADIFMCFSTRAPSSHRCSRKFQSAGMLHFLLYPHLNAAVFLQKARKLVGAGIPRHRPPSRKVSHPRLRPDGVLIRFRNGSSEHHPPPSPRAIPIFPSSLSPIPFNSVCCRFRRGQSCLMAPSLLASTAIQIASSPFINGILIVPVAVSSTSHPDEDL
ncbi:hypothetical protein NEOLEDRAFT_258686 [Neolentinus lepideus HHB14362 ss-1]|uniref:Uncharacterized protein n=1 Tax=Neolentinus lepideus HHB14362 ss-1 TaxID=1314782 RepID=A0A165M8Y6_9AGAM|nr:hypothetical protein NEOLEDRAFT_258686 [Neolentinus lepideus HHB14362 ss-1]